ncbi:MAG TPA: hypothetical protein VM580_12810 [Labilithrix sp.]|nr:hypothetical protein [Labilithrix sp.]
MNGAEMVAISDWTAECVQKHHPGEPPFLLVDNRQSTGFTSDARPALANHPLARAEVCAAMWGATFAVRTFINLIYRALALATGAKSVTKAFVSEEEASRWLVEQQTMVRSRKKSRDAA